jgi:peptidyl-prolyl cis-trans isomerase C
MKHLIKGLLAGSGIICGGFIGLQAAEAEKLPSPSSFAMTNLFADKVVARAKGFQVKQSQVDAAYTAYRASKASQGQIIPESQRIVIESNLVERLMVVQLLMNKATPEEKVKAKERADRICAQYRAGDNSEEAFNRQLMAMGLSNDQLETRILEQATCEEVIDREIKSKINITPEQIKRYYDDNPDKFQQPESAKVTHVLLSIRDDRTGQELPADFKKTKRQEAEKVLARAKAGDDFSALVKEYSDDLGSKDRNGEYTFSRGRMLPEFESAAFSMKPGQISDVVTTSFGYHIIKLIEKIPPHKLPFEEVEKRIAEELRFRETQKELPSFLDRVKKDAGVEWLNSGS